jgi:hypothetical protein
MHACINYDVMKKLLKPVMYAFMHTCIKYDVMQTMSKLEYVCIYACMHVSIKYLMQILLQSGGGMYICMHVCTHVKNMM